VWFELSRIEYLRSIKPARRIKIKKGWELDWKVKKEKIYTGQKQGGSRKAAKLAKNCRKSKQ
jgi:hypothetical protein